MLKRGQKRVLFHTFLTPKEFFSSQSKPIRFIIVLFCIQFTAFGSMHILRFSMI